MRTGAKEEIRSRIAEIGIIPAVRLHSAEDALFAAESVSESVAGILFDVATAQKFFPCGQLGGSSYIRALKGPFEQIPLIASGGADQETAGDFIRAGAAALGIGRHLIHPDAIKRGESGWIREPSRRYLSLVAQARDLIER